jgi:hypothetical protein
VTLKGKPLGFNGDFLFHHLSADKRSRGHRSDDPGQFAGAAPVSIQSHRLALRTLSVSREPLLKNPIALVPVCCARVVSGPCCRRATDKGRRLMVPLKPSHVLSHPRMGGLCVTANRPLLLPEWVKTGSRYLVESHSILLYFLY